MCKDCPAIGKVVPRGGCSLFLLLAPPLSFMVSVLGGLSVWWFSEMPGSDSMSFKPDIVAHAFNSSTQRLREEAHRLETRLGNLATWWDYFSKRPGDLAQCKDPGWQSLVPPRRKRKKSMSLAILVMWVGSFPSNPVQFLNLKLLDLMWASWSPWTSHCGQGKMCTDWQGSGDDGQPRANSGGKVAPPQGGEKVPWEKKRGELILSTEKRCSLEDHW